MSDQIQQVFTVPGSDKTFSSKAEAQDFLRRPKITAALLIVTGNNKELTDWLIDNQDTVEDAFDTGTIKRVTKSEKNKLDKACEKLVAHCEKNPSDAKDFGFLFENIEAVKDSFRWPKVKRMTAEEKAVAAKNTLMAASEDNAELSDWVIANEEKIIEAFAAGKEKREVSPQAANGLAAYRHGMAVAKKAKAEGKTQEEADALGKKAMEEMKAATAAAA